MYSYIPIMYAKLHFVAVIVDSLFQKFLNRESFAVFRTHKFIMVFNDQRYTTFYPRCCLIFYSLRYFPVFLYQQEYFSIIIILRINKINNIDNISKAELF